MEENQRRTSPWKAVTFIALAILVAAAAVGMGIRTAADRRWARLEQRTEDLYRQWESRPGRRLPLWGAPLPGNAWDDYLAAAQSMKKFPEADRQALVSFLLRSADADPALVRSLVERHGGSLDFLSRGAHREEARYRHPQNLREKKVPPDVLQAPLDRLSLLARCKARLLQEDGRNRDAMELLLDLIMAGLDIAHRSFGTDEQDGSIMMWAALRELRDMVVAGRLERMELKDLAQRLSDAESWWPLHGWALDGKLLDVGWLFQREDQWNEPQMTINGVPHPRREWRTFFSTRLKAVETFSRAEAWVQKAAAAEALPWSQSWPVLQGLFQESETDPDWVIQGFGVLTGTVMFRDTQATARLLRMGCRFRETGEVLELEDPFGGKLSAVVRDGRLRAWSRGAFTVGPAPQEPSPTHPEHLQIEVGR